MPITTLLFDLGGVVCRFFPERRLALLAADCNLSPVEVHARLWESGFSRDCDLGRYSAEQMLAEARRRIGLSMDFATFQAAWTSAFEPDVDVLSIVDSVAVHHRTAMLTDNAMLLAEALPMLLPEVARWFEPRLFSAALGACKPDPEIYRRALARLGEPAANVLFVDDTPAAVAGARDAGHSALLFTDAQTLSTDLARLLPDRHDETAQRADNRQTL